MTAWTHHDPAVRKLIRQAQAEVLETVAAQLCDMRPVAPESGTTAQGAQWALDDALEALSNANPYREETP